MNTLVYLQQPLKIVGISYSGGMIETVLSKIQFQNFHSVHKRNIKKIIIAYSAFFTLEIVSYPRDTIQPRSWKFLFPKETANRRHTNSRPIFEELIKFNQFHYK